MDVDSLPCLPSRQMALKLQWSHVLMDVDSSLTESRTSAGPSLQWSHVLMDVDRIMREQPGHELVSFNGATS